MLKNFTQTFTQSLLRRNIGPRCEAYCPMSPQRAITAIL